MQTRNWKVENTEKKDRRIIIIIEHTWRDKEKSKENITEDMEKVEEGK